MDEQSDIRYSMPADAGIQSPAMTKSDMNHDTAIAAVVLTSASRSRVVWFELSYMLNIHITYSIHSVCPHMYSHDLV